MTVNHSKEFVNSQTGAHTSTLESVWRVIKTSLPKHGTVKSLYDTYFGKKTSKQLSWLLSNFLGVCLDSFGNMCFKQEMKDWVEKDPS